MNAEDITRALATRQWDYRKHVCVPRCCLAGHEADLLILQPSGYVEEVEIKISGGDFRKEFSHKADKHRRLQMGVPTFRYRKRLAPDEVAFDPANPLHVATSEHIFDDYTDPKPHLIRRFWFAMPMELARKLEADVPAYCGLIGVDERGRLLLPRTLRPAPNLRMSRKADASERLDFYRLGYLRFWDVAGTYLAKEGAHAKPV